jgi:hypothetical protein
MTKKFTIITFIGLLPLLTTAQWNGNPSVAGNPVCTAPTNEEDKISITDGRNGSIVVFSSRANTSTSESVIYVQRITSNGFVAWSFADNPKAITATGQNYLQDVIADGAGGAFIAWESAEEVFIQHINSSGNITWADNGINVSNNTAREHSFARLCLDGSGGIIVTWSSEIYDNVNEVYTYLQVFAQRYNSTGVAQWAAGGVQLSTAAGFRYFSEIVTDGAGGAIIFFIDTRNSTYLPGADEEFPNIDIYAQRISAAGNRLWTDNGADICTETNIQHIEPQRKKRYAVSDGAGGAIVVFEDYRTSNAGTSDLYTQRINSSGTKQWTAAGVFVCVASDYQSVINVVSNGAQGIVVAWHDERSSNERIYAQQVNASGTTLWTTNGVLLSGATNSANYNGHFQPDGLGNYIATWHTNYKPELIKAQKLDATGVVQWTTGGVSVYTNPNSYLSFDPPPNAEVVISENGKAIVTWNENRGGASQTDIYARKLEPNGTLPITLIDFSATSTQGNVLLKWTTANEQNTLDFEIERGSDNIQFTYLGKVDAAGSSSVNKSYQFVDKASLTGTAYYRLKQRDKDGAFTYSPVRIVVFNTGNSLLKLLGNPVYNQAVLQYVSSHSHTAQVRVIDQSGKIVFIKQISIEAGANQIRFATSHLPKGIYEVELVSTKEFQKLRMLKK